MKKLMTALTLSFAALGVLSGCDPAAPDKDGIARNIRVYPEAGLVVEYQLDLTIMADFNENSLCKMVPRFPGTMETTFIQTCTDFEDIKSAASTAKVEYLRQFLPK
jgi:hypothetical protein